MDHFFDVTFKELRIRIAVGTIASCLEANEQNLACIRYESAIRVMDQLSEELKPEVLAMVGDDWQDQLNEHLQTFY